MRQWIIFGVGAAIGMAIAITIGEVFTLSRIAEKILVVSCAMLGACTAMGIAAMRGWIPNDQLWQ